MPPVLFPSQNKPLYLQSFHFLKDLGRLREHPGPVEVNLPHNSILVDDNHRPLWHAVLIVVDTIGLRDCALGLEVRKHWVWNLPQRRSEGFLNGSAVHTDAQYLGACLLELGVGTPERGDLVCSTAGKRQDVPGKNDDLVALELAQADLCALMRLQREVRGRLSYFDHRVLLLAGW